MYGYQPNYQAMSYMAQPQIVPQQKVVPQIGRWLTVNSYQEVQSTPIPADGTPSIFMLSDKPIFYVVSMSGGQKFINGYTFTSLNATDNVNTSAATENQPSATNNNDNDINNRLTKLEESVAQLATIVEEATHKHESHPSTATAAKPKQSGRN